MILFMNSNGFSHSFTKNFIINVERITVMNRTYSRAVLCFSCMKSSNKSPCSVMSLLNIETLAVFRWTCLTYLCFNKSPRSVWWTDFVKRINIDLLGTGRFSFILHFIRSPWSITNWMERRWTAQRGKWRSRRESNTQHERMKMTHGMWCAHAKLMTWATHVRVIRCEKMRKCDVWGVLFTNLSVAADCGQL